jgi:hypothetical protein
MTVRLQNDTYVGSPWYIRKFNALRVLKEIHAPPSTVSSLGAWADLELRGGEE